MDDAPQTTNPLGTNLEEGLLAQSFSAEQVAALRSEFAAGDTDSELKATSNIKAVVARLTEAPCSWYAVAGFSTRFTGAYQGYRCTGVHLAVLTLLDACTAGTRPPSTRARRPIRRPPPSAGGSSAAASR